MKKMIGLAGPSSGFLHRLTDYVNGQGEVEVFLCTKEDTLQEELDRRKPTVIFVMKGFAEEVDISVPKVFFVVEEDDEGIYQYQSARALYKNMSRYIWKETRKKVMTDRKKEMCAVYSPLGRSGKTSFAFAYAKEFSFFYIGMEEYGIKTNDFCSEGRIFYYIKNRKPDLIPLMLEWMENREGISVFGSPSFYGDMRFLEAEDFEWFLEELRNHSEVPSVLIDFGSGCLGDLSVLDLFDQVFIPVLDGVEETRKIDRFKELLFEINGRMENKKKEMIVPKLSWKEPDFLSRIQYMDGLSYES